MRLLSMTDYYDRDGDPLPDDWYYIKSFRRSSITDHRVARTNVRGIDVSTAWLGLDHNVGCGPPFIFETMTFDGPWSGEYQRYSTEENAIRGHLNVIDRLRAGKAPFAYLDDPDGDE